MAKIDILNKRPSIGILKYCSTHADKHSGNNLKKWMTFYKTLRGFEIYCAKTLMSNDFEKPLLTSFIGYLTNEKNYKQNTVFGNWNLMRSLLYKCFADGYAVNLASIKSVRVKAAQPTAIYLTIDEVKLLERFKIDGCFEKVRDLFLIGCYTGLRYSDLVRIKKEHIQKDFISILTCKTQEQVVIPLHPAVRKLLEKYGGEIPANFTASWYNKTVKIIARDAGINSQVIIEEKRGNGVLEIKNIPKWKLISSHTARRSYATNMYLAKKDAPVYQIMLITGHKTEESFFRYIRISKEENAKQLLNHPFFKGE